MKNSICKTLDIAAQAWRKYRGPGMAAGGNARLRGFLAGYGLADAAPAEKYGSVAAAWCAELAPRGLMTS